MQQKVEKYSVLMSVYAKEQPEFLEQSILSILNQTVKTDDFVLVCDGPLTPKLDKVIARYCDMLNLVRLPQNGGLGNALNAGLAHCKYDLVARMDSDDICFENRCGCELEIFAQDNTLDIVSAALLEFEKSSEEITGKRLLPEKDEEIRAFSHKRNPFNHPVVMFRKSAVEAAGSYQETYHLFEDYYLWVRMLQNGAKGKNLSEPLLYMRTPHDMYLRRGGAAYAKDLLRFHRWLYKSGWSSFGDYCTSAVPHATICVLPNGLRKWIYKKVHN